MEPKDWLYYWQDMRYKYLPQKQVNDACGTFVAAVDPQETC